MPEREKLIPRIGWDFTYLDLSSDEPLLKHDLTDVSIAAGVELGTYYDWRAGLSRSREAIAGDRWIGPVIRSRHVQRFVKWLLLPALLYYEKHPADPTIHSVIVKNGHSAQELDDVIQEIRMSPEMGAARQEAQALANEAIRELDVLPKTKYRQALAQLAEYVLERKK